MKTFIALLTLASCALAFGAKPADQADQVDAKKQSQKPKNAPKQQVAPMQQRTLPNAKVQKPRVERSTNAVTNNVVPKNVPKKERVLPAVQSNNSSNVQSKKSQTSKQQKVQTNQAPATNAPAPTTTAAPASNATATNVQTSKVKVNPETVKKIQAQYANFSAKPNTAIASAQFDPNYRIQAAQNWNGTQYNAFRTYQPQWHDQSYWSSHYPTLSLIAGGWYYWDNGYWYPAWGYDQAASYYPYDGPIYVGPRARPFDQVVANVQAVLQEQGYYRGEVDGLVGPLTRQALTAFQQAAGLPPTASIDQPTLELLGLS